MDIYLKKSLNIAVLACCMGFVALMVFFKVELMSKQAKANVTLFAYDAEWQYFQYQQSLREQPGQSLPRQ